ncbi:Ras-related protein Rab-8A [Elysia marginata]|uniref:Ras-related protein Rab-8A n=1 Tax=Elysia marginata TaxID=1093978 RepID=A0AAV4FM02_9GAST|nr:Ras-related protein Rab-8A [Elysia marginata]
MAKPFDHLFKIVVIGDYGSGKSSLIHRFANLEMPPLFTLGIDFQICRLELDLKKIKLQIWDTMISPRFRFISRSYFRGTKGMMIVYDITDRDSFDAVQTWKRQVDEYADPKTVLMLVGNKCDLQSERQVSIQEGKQLAAEFGIWFMETSALEDINVEQAFVSLTQDIKQTVETAPPVVMDKRRSCILS